MVLAWMIQPALTASNRVIGYRLTGIKVAKTCDSRVPSEKNGCHQPRFCVRSDKDVSRTRPIPGEGKGLRSALFEDLHIFTGLFVILLPGCTDQLYLVL